MTEKELSNEAEWIRKFDKCPVCGSAERYFEGILNDLKAKGFLDNKVECFNFQLQAGVGLPPQKIEMLPMGSEFPSFKKIWDSCSQCGVVYDVHQEVSTAKKALAPVQLYAPNRADRRRQEHQNLN